MKTEISLLLEFENFIKVSSNGKRRITSGKKLSEGTVQQYQIVKGYLLQFEQALQQPIRIKMLYGNSKKQFNIERRYWNTFKIRFEQYLRTSHQCLDSYIAAVFKVIKTFFNYLQYEKGLPVGSFHKNFTLPVYHYQPILLDTFQLKRLLQDKVFSETLPSNLQASLDLFIFGCLVGLRFQDLLNLRRTNLHTIGPKIFLQTTSKKTGIYVSIPLPDFAIKIIERSKKRNSKLLFEKISNVNFNIHVKKIIELAGYTYPVPKFRYKNGKLTELKTKEGKTYRFCDHISAHTMRRTAITNLLILGVPEMVVRKISGHAPGSKEFFKYVSIAQDYTNQHVENAYKILEKNE